jgi:transcription elongation factor Elf1
MRVTIVKDDNKVYMDGVSYTVDCSDLPEGFHALQWDGLSGEIEYSTVRCDHCGARTKKANEFIRDAAPYQKYVDAWGVAKAAAEAEAAKALQAQAEVANAAGPQG